MEIDSIKCAETSIVQVQGDIELEYIDEFRRVLNEAAAESPCGFIIDLTDTGYIDSAGLGAIFAAYRKVTHCGGKIAIVVNASVNKIFKLVRAEMMPGFIICSDLDDAAQAFRSSGEADEQ